MALTCMSLPTLQETVPQQLSTSLAAPSLPVNAPAAEEELPATPTHHIDGNQDTLNEQLDTIFQQYGVKGCSVAAFEGEEIVYTHSYGIARGNQPADENTKYRIASISKAVTAALAMHLVDQGKLSLEDELASIHPALQNPAYPDDPATLQMLLTHTSGIIDGAGYNRAISRGTFPSLDVVMQSNNFSGSRPGERYSYSNFGLGLVCAAIEQATGIPFRDYAKSELFDPLGLDAGFMTNDIDDPQTIAALGSVDPLSWGDMEKAYSQIPLGQMYLLGQGELYISAARWEDAPAKRHEILSQARWCSNPVFPNHSNTLSWQSPWTANRAGSPSPACGAAWKPSETARSKAKGRYWKNSCLHPKSDRWHFYSAPSAVRRVAVPAAHNAKSSLHR